MAVDGSEFSQEASYKAIELAKVHSASLTALYVVPLNMRYGYTGHGIMTGFPEPLKEILAIALEKGRSYVDQVKNFANDRGVNIQTDVIVGAESVSKDIVKYAEDHNFDLIIIGTRGMTGIKKMLLGSTASDVVTYAHCPVLVIK
jgi:nucleotide-binding universal stress UspA family protein